MGDKAAMIEYGAQFAADTTDYLGDKKMAKMGMEFYDALKTDAQKELDKSLAGREATKLGYGVGDTYKKYFDYAMADPTADLQRQEALRGLGSSLGVLKSAGARSITALTPSISSEYDTAMTQIGADEYGRKTKALETFGGYEQDIIDQRYKDTLKDYRDDLTKAREQLGAATLGYHESDLARVRANYDYASDTLETVSDVAGEFARGGKLPGEFSHDSNPIHLMRNGQKVAEATGGEYVIPPGEAQKIAKESPFARRLFARYSKKAAQR